MSEPSSSSQKTPPLGPELATDLVHADHEFHGSEVSPSISVTTSSSFPLYLDKSGHHISWVSAFRQTESSVFPVQDILDRPELIRGTKANTYSRASQSVSTRVEHVLSKINVRIYTFLDKLSL